MAQPADLITKYERIAEFSDMMRRAAELQDWKLFSALEKDCSLAVTDLRTSCTYENLPAEVMPIRQHVLKQVLANDASIRSLIQPDLQKILQRLSHRSIAPPESG
jgi:flagellar protein FliT